MIGLCQDTCDHVRPHASLECRPPAPVIFPDFAIRPSMMLACSSFSSRSVEIAGQGTTPEQEAPKDRGFHTAINVRTGPRQTLVAVLTSLRER